MFRAPVWLVFIAGLFMASAFFIPVDPFPMMQTWALKWDVIVAAFALVVGVDSLVMHHIRRVQRRQNVLYSGTLLVGFWVTIAWGAFAWWRYGGPFATQSTFLWLFRYIVVPMDATMFSLLAFFIASAAYRAFRARNFSSSLLLLSAGIVMLGRVPFGDWAAAPIFTAFALLLAFYFLRVFRQYEGWGRGIRLVVGIAFLAVGIVLLWPVWLNGQIFPAFRFVVHHIQGLAGWIMEVPQMAARRGIDLGISLGSLAFALRVLVGIERGYMR
ncbi:MAG: hypothetical protein ABIM88_01950 [candidate division WOR-3 bacterium]